MREIDFIPDWYKKTRKKNTNYYRQYLIVGGLTAILVVWSFVNGLNVAKAKAEVEDIKLCSQTGENITTVYSELKKKYEVLNGNLELVGKVENKLCFSDVIAEISHLASENILVKEMHINSELFSEEKKTGRASKASALENDDAVFPPGPVKFKVTLKGLASDSLAVADLIKKLEQSSYFKNIIPGFSRNKEVNNIELSEFEVCFYINNYIEHEEAK